MSEMHEGCGLRSKTPAELTEMCAKAVEDKEWTDAYHAAVHHMKVCHLGTDKNSLDLFHEHLPGSIQAGSEIVKVLSTQLNEHLVEQSANALEGAPFQMKIASGMMLAAISTDLTTVGMMSYLSGAHLSVYVATKGQHCLFGLIDPDLCKEAVTA